MGYQHTERSDHATAEQASHGAAPGKRTRSEGLPAHHDMSGIDAIDRAASLAEQDEADGFPPTARPLAVSLLVNAVGGRDRAQHAALSNVLLDEATRKVWSLVEWNALVEALWRVGTGPLSPLGALAIARVANGFAVPAAQLGLTKAAWVLASDAKQLKEIATVGITSLRTHLAHPHPPEGLAEHTAFIRLVQSAIGPAARDFVEAAAATPMADLLGAYEALRGDEVYDVSRYERGVRELIAMFDTNSIAKIGDVRPVYGGIELATVRRVRIHGRLFCLLLKDFGAEHSPTEAAAARTTVQTLTFVRFIETPMHDLAVSELKRKRGEHALEDRSVADILTGNDDGVEVIDFDRDRAAHPWYRDMMHAYGQRVQARTLDEVAATPESPYGLHLAAAGADGE